MYRIYLIIIISLVVSSGCGTNLAESTGVTGEDNDFAAEDSNSNVETLETEVPEFAVADRALEKGIEYLDKNRIEMAIDALSQAVALDEDLAMAHFQLGVALSLKESEEEKLVPEDFGSEEPKKVKKSEKKGSEVAFENAVKAYKKLIAKDRKDHAANFNLGRAYVKLYDDKKARAALERAVRLKGDDPQYRTELGSVLIKLAQYSSAIKQLDKALELEEDNYRAEDLLVKAKAGRKRVDFVPKDKRLSSSRSSSKSSNVSNGATRPREVPDTAVAKPPPNRPSPPKKSNPPAPPKKN